MLAALGLEAQFCLEPGEAANVVADRHPAAAGERLQLERHDEAACKPLFGAERLAGRDLLDARGVERVELAHREVAE